MAAILGCIADDFTGGTDLAAMLVDSTPQGNIGPVAEALMDALGADFTIACPAFPANRRTIYQGYLFVGDVLLNESGMQHHPLTPMTEPT
jgi:3-dehydrotetronate 4-kinase